MFVKNSNTDMFDNNLLHNDISGQANLLWKPDDNRLGAKHNLVAD